MREEAEAGKARGYLDHACGEFTQAGYTVHRTRQCMLLGQQTGQYTPSEIDPADRIVLCCVSVFTETWLNNSIPDSAIQLDRLTCYRADRALTEGGKTRGGGVCVYIRDALVSGRCGGLQTLFTPCRVYDQVPAFLFTEGVF